MLDSYINARCSRWWKNDTTNLQGKEPDSLTLSAGHNQIIDTTPCRVDLIFCINENVISNHGIDVSVFDKCYHNIIYGKINCTCPSNIKKQILEILRKQYITLNGIKLLKNSQ